MCPAELILGEARILADLDMSELAEASFVERRTSVVLRRVLERLVQANALGLAIQSSLLQPCAQAPVVVMES